jgi:membrane associated rhomboid family serine protease
VREGRASAPRTRSPLLSQLRNGNQPVVTWTLIALNVIIFVLQLVSDSVTAALLFVARLPWEASEPWRMITYAFVHSPGSLLHIGLNMLSLFLFGPLLERSIGRGRFITLYLVSAFGGAVAVALVAPGSSVLGASGAIFGLLGAFFVIQRKLGGNTVQLMVVIAINLVIGFLPGTNISWQAHVGGLVAGAAVAFVYLRTRRREQRVTQIIMVTLIVAVLVALSATRIVLASA